jgi:hypothetical protein
MSVFPKVLIGKKKNTNMRGRMSVFFGVGRDQSHCFSPGRTHVNEFDYSWAYVSIFLVFMNGRNNNGDTWSHMSFLCVGDQA